MYFWPNWGDHCSLFTTFLCNPANSLEFMDVVWVLRFAFCLFYTPDCTLCPCNKKRHWINWAGVRCRLLIIFEKAPIAGAYRAVYSVWSLESDGNISQWNDSITLIKLCRNKQKSKLKFRSIIFFWLCPTYFKTVIKARKQQNFLLM